MEDFEDEDNYLYIKNGVRLSSSLNIRDVCSDAGAAFEVEENEAKLEEGFPYDENFVNKLSMNFGVANAENSDSDENDATNILEPFEILLLDMEDISENGGVYKKILKTGIGGDISPNGVVSFHYAGYLEYCDEPFDSSLLRKGPEKYRLGSKRILPGLELALKSMIKNEKSRFILNSEYAYGEVGCEPRIPRNAKVLFEITIIDVFDSFDAEIHENIDAESSKFSFDKCMAYAKSKHREGNVEMRNTNLRKALKCYRSATWKLEVIASTSNETEEMERDKELVILFNNIAQVSLDLNEPKQACEYCKRALQKRCLDRITRSKTYFRFGNAKSMLHDFEDSKNLFKKAEKLSPNNPKIRNALQMLDKKIEESKNLEKVTYKKMFSSANIEESEIKSDCKYIYVAKENDVCLNVNNKFEDDIVKKLSNFVEDKNTLELSIPCTLTHDELVFVIAKAEDFSCEAEIMFQGASPNSVRVTKK